MNQKPKIQYIGQFYVFGSEARALEQENQPRKPKTQLPIAKLEQIEKIYVDPVALVALAVAFILFCTMLLGLVQIQNDWAEHQEMTERVHTLRERNHKKTEEFRKTYDLKDIRAKAEAMGMVPKAEAEHMVVKVTLPEIEKEPTMLDNIQWFLKGLFA